MCRYFSIVAVAVGAILFMLTSFSDPGTVTDANVSQYLSAYPYDDIIFVEKQCSTCKITRYILLICQLVIACRGQWDNNDITDFFEDLFNFVNIV